MEKEQRKRVDVVSTRVVRESSILYHNRNITKPQSAVDLFKLFLDDVDREMLVVLCLNTKNAPTALQVVSVGSLSSSIVHPREVFKIAITSNAASVILSHCHPSGDPSPSREDEEITRRLVQAGEILGIKVLDHLIIGSGTDKWISLREIGIM